MRQAEGDSRASNPVPCSEPRTMSCPLPPRKLQDWQGEMESVSDQ